MTDKTPKDAILQALANESDQKVKMLLLLMLSAIEDIGGKLDAVLQNEERIRAMVLNGHAPVHHADHEWIGRRRKTDERDLRVMAWAEQAMGQEDINRKRCAWVDAKMRDDAADADSRRGVRDKWIERMVWAVTVLAAWSIAQGLNIKAGLS
jgi:hypothetical protein